MAFNVLFATAVLYLTALSLSVEGSGKMQPVDEPCLGCLCEANGECSPHMKCSGEVCAYPKCANDAKCARSSVIGYMKRYAQDCNNDGVIDCYDYAAIHKMGGFGCKSPLPQDYEIRFKTCQLSLKQLSG